MRSVDDLRACAGALAASAERKKSFEVAEASGKRSAACVRCHAACREGTQQEGGALRPSRAAS